MAQTSIKDWKFQDAHVKVSPKVAAGFLAALKNVVKPTLSAAAKSRGGVKILPVAKRVQNLAKAYPRSTTGLALGAGYIGTRTLFPKEKQQPPVFMS